MTYFSICYLTMMSSNLSQAQIAQRRLRCRGPIPIVIQSLFCLELYLVPWTTRRSEKPFVFSTPPLQYLSRASKVTKSKMAASALFLGHC